MTSEKRAVIKIFCSYSDEDRSFQENLEKHLTSLVREGSAVFWDKHKVTAGRCKRWKGNSALLLSLFALLDLFLLPYTVYQRSQSKKTTVGVLCLSSALFLFGVFNDDNAIGVPVALFYFPIWIVMGTWYLNSYLSFGWSQFSILVLVLITTSGHLFLFLWRSPIGQR